MNADGCKECRVFIRQPHSRFEIRRTFARADDHHPLDSRSQSAVDGSLSVGIELGIV